MGELELKEDEYAKIGKLLSTAVINKEHMHPGDMRRAALLIYNIIKNRFVLYDSELEKAIEISGERYSDGIKKYLFQMVDVLNDLSEGQRNENGEHYNLKRN